MTTQTLFARGSVKDCGSRNLRRSDKHVPFDARDRRSGFPKNQALGIAPAVAPTMVSALAPMRALHHPKAGLCKQRQPVYALPPNVHAHKMCTVDGAVFGKGRRFAADLPAVGAYGF
ncbi:hypothetical protein N5B55_02285 [Ralstonia pickettii]|uniref:hypothetical protein n=1 Tax=Ralstonia pickettii TaxID=329 RepID=UPI002714D7A2|nr:hypothetical protein [Ralstonia pickettii]WKZ85805.1 hypothetical protein N5B55_02285 [Ralstonia pickettii]